MFSVAIAVSRANLVRTQASKFASGGFKFPIGDLLIGVGPPLEYAHHFQ
jgi:hypothetical protein